MAFSGEALKNSEFLANILLRKVGIHLTEREDFLWDSTGEQVQRLYPGLTVNRGWRGVPQGEQGESSISKTEQQAKVEKKIQDFLLIVLK